MFKALSSDFDSLGAHKVNRVYQVWQEGAHAEVVYSENVMQQKLDYIHQNPVKRGYVDFGEEWR
jgi:putative transposase